MGLWDPVCHRDPWGERLLCESMADALRSVRHVDELYHATRARAVARPFENGLRPH